MTLAGIIKGKFNFNATDDKGSEARIISMYNAASPTTDYLEIWLNQADRTIGVAKRVNGVNAGSLFDSSHADYSKGDDFTILFLADATGLYFKFNSEAWVSLINNAAGSSDWAALLDTIAIAKDNSGASLSNITVESLDIHQPAKSRTQLAALT